MQKILTGKRHSLTTKFAVLFGVFALVVGTFVCAVTYASYSWSMLGHYGKYSIGVAVLAASVLDPDELLRYAETLEQDERYAVIKAELDNIRRTLGIEHLSVRMPVSETEYIYLFDLHDEDTELGTSLGGRGIVSRPAIITGEHTRQFEAIRFSRRGGLRKHDSG